MAKITDLAVVQALEGDESLPMVQDGVTRRVGFRGMAASMLPFLPAAFKGDPGAAGNVAANLVQLKGAPIGADTMLWGGVPFRWETARAPYTADEDQPYITTVRSIHQPLTVGAWVRQGAADIAYDRRAVSEKLGEWVSIRDTRFAGGARGDGRDDTAAIQAALDTGVRCIYLPPGDYHFTKLFVRYDYQRLFGPGARLIRTSATGTILVTARGVHLTELLIGCQTSGMAGDNITVSGPDFRAIYCESRDCAGRAILALNCGGGFVIEGGTYQTTDTTADGWDIEIRHTAGGTNTLYCFLSKILTNQHWGGVLFNGDVGSSAIDKSEFGKLGMINGGSAKVSNCRVGGVSTLRSGFASLSQSDFNDDIVIGEDGKPNIGSVRFAPTCTLKAGKTLTVCNNVVESSLHLDQIQSAGAHCVIRGYHNAIWHREVDAPLQIGAQSGSPTFGDGTLYARMASEGRRTVLHVSFQLGAQSSLGGGNFFFFIAPFKARSASTDIAQVTQAGVGHWTLALRMLEGSDQIFFFPTSAPGAAAGNNASGTNPFPWKAGDRLVFRIEFERIF